MPKLGESVTEGTITAWFVKKGDIVKKYDPLAEVQTDKVTAEVPSSYAGVITELIAQEGETLQVGELICYIETDGQSGNDNRDDHNNKDELEISTIHVDETNQSNKHRYSPAVLRLSQEHNIDLSKVVGTGNGGRITRKDLQRIIETGNIPQTKEESEKAQPVQKVSFEKSVETFPQSQLTSSKAKQTVGEPFDIEIPVTAVRKAIANNMVRSKHEAPHAWTMIEVDVTNLVAYRETIKDEFIKNEGFPLTYFAFFVKAVAQALKEYPMINSMWAGEKIIQKKDINISIAVATEDALYVPVIKNADEKTIKAIAREIYELANKVRSGKLSLTDMEGGTFTVNNTGSFGSIQSMGIINYPQAAILQVESIVKRPIVFNENMIAIRDLVNLCMSLDHRVLDGLICGRFLVRIKEILENITNENTPIY